MKSSGYCFLLMIAFLSLQQCSIEKYPDGKRFYENNCENCHFPDGQGFRELNPPLAQSDFLIQNRNALPCIILNGLDGPIQVNGITYDHPMPGSPHLHDAEITNIINYINSAWGNDQPYMTLQEVSEALASCRK